MSLADSVDEGDLSPYDLFDDWEAVEVEQRRKVRVERTAYDRAIREIMDLETSVYLLQWVLNTVLELWREEGEYVTRLERQLEYEAVMDNRDFWAAVEARRRMIPAELDAVLVSEEDLCARAGLVEERFGASLEQLSEDS